MEFKVIDKAEQGASALSVKVTRRLIHDTSTRQLRHELASYSPGLGGRHIKLKRRNLFDCQARLFAHLLSDIPVEYATLYFLFEPEFYFVEFSFFFCNIQ